MKTNNGQTTKEIHTNKRPKVCHSRIFGSSCYVHVPKQQHNKFDNKATKCLFFGYDEQNKMHRMYNLSTNKILLSCDVVFEESKISYD
jgi:hypothetical protein